MFQTQPFHFHCQKGLNIKALGNLSKLKNLSLSEQTTHRLIRRCGQRCKIGFRLDSGLTFVFPKDMKSIETLPTTSIPTAGTDSRNPKCGSNRRNNSSL